VRPPEGYKLLDAYARDTTGVFYRARQLKLDREVTVKALREELKDNARARAIFLQESRLIAGLEHPNLLGTISTGVVDDIPYFVTESALEPTLAEAMEDGGPLPERRAVAIAVGIARALRYLEGHQLIYKNLRRKHVLLPRPAAAKLLTFRNVRSISEAPLFRSSNVQSGAYCAPELVRDDLGPVTVKANVYALGALLYWMLAGVPPVEGTGAEARAAHAEGRVRPLRETRSYLRDRAHAVVSRLLCHDPAQRADPAAAIALLEAYHNDPLVTHPPTKKRRKRRRP